MDADARTRTADDDRTPAQRRADALSEIYRQRPDRADRPTAAGERPHVTITVDVDALASGSGSAEVTTLDPRAHSWPVGSRATRRSCGWSCVGVLGPGYPIAPSICSSTSRLSSTAYSIGSSRVMGSMNPFTIIALASASVSPRLIR
jgi:hypothetical protein